MAAAGAGAFYSALLVTTSLNLDISRINTLLTYCVIIYKSVLRSVLVFGCETLRHGH